MVACNFRYLSKKIEQKSIKNLQIPNFVLPLQSQSANGALVQLVRIRACHARGQGFESPTHRTKTDDFRVVRFFCFVLKAKICVLIAST